MPELCNGKIEHIENQSGLILDLPNVEWVIPRTRQPLSPRNKDVHQKTEQE